MCDRINVQVKDGEKRKVVASFSYGLDGIISCYREGVVPEVHAEEILSDWSGVEPVKGKEEIVERFIAQCRLKGIFPQLKIREK